MEQKRTSICQVVLMDGTFASLTEGQRSSIARIHAMLSGEYGPTGRRVQLYYAPGQQWAAWRTLPQLLSGETLDQNIRDAYAWVARHWRPGNPLFLFGYSRGGIGVCALADMIDQMGLLLPDEASAENVLGLWNSYRYGCAPQIGPQRRHDHVPIRMVGLLDTVMSLGIQTPFQNSGPGRAFDYARGRLAPNVACGAHALALDETRHAFAPVLWERPADHQSIEQMWFHGCHPDIGGQLCGYEAARQLANLPLVWLMARAQEAGLPLPDGWQRRHPCDHRAPSLGSWHQWGKVFLHRSPRRVGLDTTEALHPSVVLPYAGPARMHGHLAWAAPPRRALRLRLGGDGGTDHSAPA